MRRVLLCLVLSPSLALAQPPAPPVPPVPPAETLPAEPPPAPATEVTAASWEQVAPLEMAALLQANLRDDSRFPAGKELYQALGVPQPVVTVKKNFPARPYLTITFSSAPDVVVDPKLQAAFVREVLGQNYFSQSFTTANPDWFGPQNLAMATTTVTVRIGYNPFEVPTGLSMSWRTLAWRLGYLPSPNSLLSVAFTREICREMAIKAMGCGLYDDAIVLANHGMRGPHAGDASLLYLRAVCEVALERSDRALATLYELRDAGGIPLNIQERLRGPATVHVALAIRTLVVTP